ncbi:MAG: preprotein translocase subunit YajC [Acidimicrobiia bacterium]|nr:preprotein translocase subunit YajC [Acidimicrobiia bacterium]
MVIIVYLLVLVAAFFFLIVLPQRRRMASHRALMEALQVGDDVVTSGGIHGTIRELDDTLVKLEIASGVVVTVARGAIATKLTPPTPDDEAD